MRRIEIRDAATNRALFVLDVKHRTTVINDNSGTGKTALINLIDSDADAGLRIISDSDIIVIKNKNDLYGAIAATGSCTLIIDESLDDTTLAELLNLYERTDGHKQQYDWWIVLVCRDDARLQDIGLYSTASLRPDDKNTIRLVYKE